MKDFATWSETPTTPGFCAMSEKKRRRVEKVFGQKKKKAIVERILKQPSSDGRVPQSLIDIAPRSMHVFIKMLDGNFLLIDNIESGDTVEQVKEKIKQIQGIPEHQQRLINISTGRNLEETRTLADYGIQTGAVIHLVFNFRAC